MKKVGFIGFGNMAQAIATGMIEHGGIVASEMVAVDTKEQVRQKAQLMGLSVKTEAIQVASSCQYLFFAVKPYYVEDILQTIQSHLSTEQTLISIAAGIGLEQLEGLSSAKYAWVRLIPNIAATVGQSVNVYALNQAAKGQEEEIAVLLSSFGVPEPIEDSLVNAATILSSCSPAYVMRYIQCMVEMGVEMGLSAPIAQRLATQTFKGSSELLLQRETTTTKEIEKVCTPGGTTIVGLNEMERNGFSRSVLRGFRKAFLRISKRV